MRLCIDTCAYTAFQNGNKDLLRLFNHCDQLIFPITVIGELQFGFANGSRYKANIELLKRFIVKSNAIIANTTMETAFRYGQLASVLRRNGTPIPQNDIWIAAITMEAGAHLATLDSDFRLVPGLPLEEF